MRRLALVLIAGCASSASPCPPVVDRSPRFVRQEVAPEPRCLAYSPATRTYSCLGLVSENGSANHPPDRHRRRQWIDGTACGDRPSAVELTPATWRRLGAARVRFDADLHEGDASFEYRATLTLDCRGIRREILLDDLVATGPRAVAFTAPGAPVHAIGVVGEDGGEGVTEWTLQTVLLDERTCTVTRLE